MTMAIMFSYQNDACLCMCATYKLSIEKMSQYCSRTLGQINELGKAPINFCLFLNFVSSGVGDSR